MNELQVMINQTPGEIRFNFEELKTQLSAKMSEYRNAVFTEESKPLAKAELANLRKLKESVDKRRKEVKVQAMEPYTAFEAKVKELLAIIDEPIALIDSQLKEMEADRIRKRHEDVRELWKKNISDVADYLPLEKIYDKKWDNATTSLKSIERDMNALADKTAAEIIIIQNSRSDASEEALGMYRKNRDLTAALTYINNYEANRKKILEQEAERRRQEEERRRREEIERAKEEERRKIEEIEQAREEERRKAEEERQQQETLRKAEAALQAAPDEPETPFSIEDDESDLPFEQPSTVTAFYKVVATPEELERVEMAFNSIGIFYERRDA